MLIWKILLVKSTIYSTVKLVNDSLPVYFRLTSGLFPSHCERRSLGSPLVALRVRNPTLRLSPVFPDGRSASIWRCPVPIVSLFEWKMIHKYDSFKIWIIYDDSWQKFEITYYWLRNIKRELWSVTILLGIKFSKHERWFQNFAWKSFNKSFQITHTVTLFV